MSDISGARCGHFGVCGGCSIQNLSYADQLALKLKSVRALLEPLGVSPERIHPSPDIWFYRNKMEFSFGDTRENPELRLGLKPKGRWYETLDLKECSLLSEETPALLESVRSWAKREGLVPFRRRGDHGGYLRNLIVREAKNTGERLVLLVTAPGPRPNDGFLKAVHAAYPATTILWGQNGSIGDTAASETLDVLEGPGFLTEKLRLDGREVKFKISPYSFFQTNTRGCETLYGLLRSWLGELKPEKVLDLYCGGGAIALSVADLCGAVEGVELVEGSILDAKENAELNGIKNASFMAQPAETFLNAEASGQRWDAIILDPPRCGLHPKAVNALLANGPKTIFYVSCNPKALAKDLTELQVRYQARRAELVDLFPHTDHVETVVELRAAL